jgi:hypothetical protein
LHILSAFFNGDLVHTFKTHIKRLLADGFLLFFFHYQQVFFFARGTCEAQLNTLMAATGMSEEKIRESFGQSIVCFLILMEIDP